MHLIAGQIDGICRSFHLWALRGEPEALLMAEFVSKGGEDRAAEKLLAATSVALCDTSENRHEV